MRYSKRYVIFLLMLGMAFGVKYFAGTFAYAQIGEFRGAMLEEEDWNPFIADSVNTKKLTIAVDNHTYDSKSTGLYMNEQLQIMVPVSILRDGFNCSVHLYDNNRLIIEKYEDRLEFWLKEETVYFNDLPLEAESVMTKIKGEYFVPMDIVADALQYTYTWNIEDNTVMAVNASGNGSILPASYDMRARARNPVIKNQGERGTCWAFSALTALESSLLPEKQMTFSPDHMSMANSFASNGNDGGQYTMSMAYLTSWQGPVLENDDPYDGILAEGLSAVVHVQEAQIIESWNLDKMKESVFKYGGVQTAIYSTLNSAQGKSVYYNEDTNAYCYLGSETPNHDVVIIGWDDNYSKDNFSVAVEDDGAFICQNSWGTDFGNNGIFYVSYFDTNIGIHNVVYTRIDDTLNYDEIYQSDLCGWVGHLGYNTDTAYGANVFTAKKKETVMAAGFYATGKNTSYDVYVVPEFVDEDSLNGAQHVASGVVENAGYYTVDFSSGVNVSAGDKFAVIFKIKTPESVHPLAVEYASDELTRTVDLTDGEGYISAQGSSWDRVEESQNCNLCIKAYTKDR